MAVQNASIMAATWLGGAWYDAWQLRWGPTVAFNLLVAISGLPIAACWILFPRLKRAACDDDIRIRDSLGRWDGRQSGRVNQGSPTWTHLFQPEIGQQRIEHQIVDVPCVADLRDARPRGLLATSLPRPGYRRPWQPRPCWRSACVHLLSNVRAGKG